MTKSGGRLSVFILLDRPLITVSFLESSIYFASVASFVFSPTVLAVPLLLPVHINSLLEEGVLSPKPAISISVA